MHFNCIYNDQIASYALHFNRITHRPMAPYFRHGYHICQVIWLGPGCRVVPKSCFFNWLSYSTNRNEAHSFCRMHLCAFVNCICAQYHWNVDGSRKRRRDRKKSFKFHMENEMSCCCLCIRRANVINFTWNIRMS